MVVHNVQRALCGQIMLRPASSPVHVYMGRLVARVAPPLVVKFAGPIFCEIATTLILRTDGSAFVTSHGSLLGELLLLGA